MLPASAGLVGSMGLTFLLKTAYLLPLTLLALVVAIAGLGYRASARRGYGPLTLGVLSAGLVITGKFLCMSDIITYAGVVLLIIASLWNAKGKANA